MTVLSGSYGTVPYDLRPAKQVERRMFVDAFQRLTLEGFDIPGYQYVGMGAAHFVDFIMFHKWLGISQMLSIEEDERARRRVHFNRPFDCVRISIEPIGAAVRRLSRKARHLLWLDYDQQLHAGILTDLCAAATRLRSGSILLATVDIMPPKRSDRPRIWKRYFEAEAGDFLPSLHLRDYSASRLPHINMQAITRAIVSTLAPRDLQFIPVFYFVYADGHKMLTVGGMIGTEDDSCRVNRALAPTSYARLEFNDPYEIVVPVLTRRERLHLDRAMPCSDDWAPKQFELRPQDVRAYREVYRFFPAYAELLL